MQSKNRKDTMAQNDSKPKQMKSKRKREQDVSGETGKKNFPQKKKVKVEDEKKQKKSPGKVNSFEKGTRKVKNFKGKQKFVTPTDAPTPKPAKKRKTRKALRRLAVEKLMKNGDAIDLRTQPELLKIQKMREMQRDGRTLYVQNTKLTKDKIRSTLTGVVNIRPIRNSFYVTFTSADAAKTAQKQISNKVFGEEEKINVDFYRKNRIGEEEKDSDKPILVDEKSLFATDFSEDGISSEEVKNLLTKMFPNSRSIRQQRRNKLSRSNFAIICFNTAEAAKEAFLKSENAELNGCKITIVYSSLKDSPKNPNTEENKTDTKQVKVKEAAEDSSDEEEDEPQAKKAKKNKLQAKGKKSPAKSVEKKQKIKQMKIKLEQESESDSAEEQPKQLMAKKKKLNKGKGIKSLSKMEKKPKMKLTMKKKVK